jgi:hypothetical protein
VVKVVRGNNLGDLSADKCNPIKPLPAQRIRTVAPRIRTVTLRIRTVTLRI